MLYTCYPAYAVQPPWEVLPLSHFTDGEIGGDRTGKLSRSQQPEAAVKDLHPACLVLE